MAHPYGDEGNEKGCWHWRVCWDKSRETFFLNKSVAGDAKGKRNIKRGNGPGAENQNNLTKMFLRIREGNESEGTWWRVDGDTHSEPAAMSRYEVSAVSTPTGTTMLMTFSADQFLSY